MGILLFVLKYMHISLLLKMINGFSETAKIMASPFKEGGDIRRDAKWRTEESQDSVIPRHCAVLPWEKFG